MYACVKGRWAYTDGQWACVREWAVWAGDGWCVYEWRWTVGVCVSGRYARRFVSGVWATSDAYVDGQEQRRRVGGSVGVLAR